MSGPSLTGYYGKVPGCGDFVSRGLPRSFVDPWDRWLQQSLLLLEAHLGPDWPRWFIALAAVRFALAPGVCGPGCWIGVMLPSRDRVGRRFPFTLCRQIGRKRVDAAVFQEEAEWYEAAEILVGELVAGGRELAELRLEGGEETGRRWLPVLRRRSSWWRCPVESQVVKALGLPDAKVLIGWVECSLAGE